jgi:hypothetical protein
MHEVGGNPDTMTKVSRDATPLWISSFQGRQIVTDCNIFLGALLLCQLDITVLVGEARFDRFT